MRTVGAVGVTWAVEKRRACLESASRDGLGLTGLTWTSVALNAITGEGAWNRERVTNAAQREPEVRSALAQ